MDSEPSVLLIWKLSCSSPYELMCRSSVVFLIFHFKLHPISEEGNHGAG